MLFVVMSCLLALPDLSGFHLRVTKAERRLWVMNGEDTMGVYYVALGAGAGDSGSKLRMGDNKTPEGVYTILSRNPNSPFYKSFLIDYPSSDDAKRGLESGVIDRREYLSILQAHRAGRLPPQSTRMGGSICIHGGHVAYDWTAGCIAVTDRGMDSLWGKVKIGTKVEILP
ncbi:MAG TPA: L,D-transpeptidase family protein [Fibrobacteria bacterium]|nr:L,D-transpeptidase family protein [Fibrobacteria bacterium]HOX52527.1 L,D-transpeptidase family protein [Fibrobacteria bacterium]